MKYTIQVNLPYSARIIHTYPAIFSLFVQRKFVQEKSGEAAQRFQEGW